MNRIHGTSPLGRYLIADSTEITPGQLVALNGSGKAVFAADTAGLKIVGVAQEVVDGEVEVFSGIVSLANGSSGAAFGCAVQVRLRPEFLQKSKSSGIFRRFRLMICI